MKDLISGKIKLSRQDSFFDKFKTKNQNTSKSIEFNQTVSEFFTDESDDSDYEQSGSSQD